VKVFWFFFSKKNKGFFSEKEAKTYFRLRGVLRGDVDNRGGGVAELREGCVGEWA